MQRARRRHIANLLIQQAAIATCAGAAGVLLLLFLGRQIFDWQWPLALLAGALAFGVYRVFRRVLPQYRIAQSLDRDLGLKDRLSTTFYFRHLAKSAPEPVEVVEKQAMERVKSEDVDRAIPLRFPRAGYGACALLLAAVGLIGVRYGLLRSLDLQQPLARINFDTFSAPPRVEAASARKSVIQEHLEKQLEELGMTLEEIDEGGKTAVTPTPTEVNSDEPGGNQKGPPGKGPNSSPAASDESIEDENASSTESGESNEEAGDDSSPQKQQSADAKKNSKSPSKNPGASQGVMDKMKDALASLLNKLGADAQEGAQENASNESQQQGGQQQMSQKGAQGQGQSQSDKQQAQNQGGQEGESGEQAPGQQQRASQQDGDKPGDQSAKSGTGKSDGDKSIQEAEQLAAMGKISEIFGKRAAEIQGEMSVEVPSGKQQLKTAYTRNSATHEGAVAESNRDEIPLIYQAYVQRYFEEVRKTAPAKAKTNTAP